MAALAAGHRVYHLLNAFAPHHAEAPDDTLPYLAHNRESEDVGDSVLHQIRFIAQVVSAVGQQRQPLLAAEHGVEFGGRIAGSIEAAHDGSDARAGNVVDGYSRLLNHLQHSDLGSTLGTAASQYESHLGTSGYRCQAAAKHDEQQVSSHIS